MTNRDLVSSRSWRTTNIFPVVYVIMLLQLLTFSVAVNPPFRIQPIDSGVLFERQADVFLTPHQGQIDVDIDWSPITREQQTFELLVKQLRTLRTVSSHVLINRVATDISDAIIRINTQISGILADVPHNRVKRAWFNAGGTILKHVFGTPDEQDSRRWNSHINELQEEIKNDETTVHYQNVRVKHIEDNLLANTQALRDFARNLKTHYQNLQDQINANLNTEQNLLNNFTDTLESIRLMQGVAYHINMIELKLTTLRAAIQTSLNRKLDLLLIPPETLLNLLQNLSLSIRPPMLLVPKLTTAAIPTYYDLIKVKIQVIEEQLRLSLFIPISCYHCHFEMYKIYTYPVLWKEIHRFIQWQTKDVLIISKDRRMHFAATTNDFRQCYQKVLFICHNLPVITTATQCEVALFLADIVHPPCTRIVHNNTKPHYQLINQGWIYSIPTSVTVTAVCYDNQLSTQTYRIPLNTSGMVFNSSMCDWHTPTFTIMVRLNRTFHTSSQPFMLFSPELAFPAPYHIELQKLNVTYDDGVLFSIDRLFNEEHKQITIDRVVQSIVDHHSSRKIALVVSTVVPTSIIVIVCVLFLYYLKRKGCFRRNRPNIEENVTVTSPGSYITKESVL